MPTPPGGARPTSADSWVALRCGVSVGRGGGGGRCISHQTVLPHSEPGVEGRTSEVRPVPPSDLRCLGGVSPLDDGYTFCAPGRVLSAVDAARESERIIMVCDW